MAITLAAGTITAARNGACNAIVDTLDLDAGNGRYILKLANNSTVVATCVGQKPFFGDAANGVATQSGNAQDPAAVGNVSAVTLFDAASSTGTVRWSGTVAESGADLNIDDGTPGGGVIIQANAVVTLSNITFTVNFS
jgi:hypothetical protein